MPTMDCIHTTACRIHANHGLHRWHPAPLRSSPSIASLPTMGRIDADTRHVHATPRHVNAIARRVEASAATYRCTPWIASMPARVTSKPPRVEEMEAKHPIGAFLESEE